MLNGSYAGILNMVRLQTDTHTLVRLGFGTLKNGSRVDMLLSARH